MQKSLVNIQFIGELYKCQILTDRKMHEIIRRLLSQPDENSVELLCCLLKIIGEKLELRTEQKISTGDVSTVFPENLKKSSPKIHVKSNKSISWNFLQFQK